MQQSGSTKAQQQAATYARGWYDMMTRIWTDRMQRMGIYHTGALHSSVRQAGLTQAGFSLTAQFQFLQYGIYVDAGVGNGYKPGNGGELLFLQKSYRQEHHLGKPREKRPWFSTSWAISCRVLADEMHRLTGDAFVGLFSDL